MFARSETNQVAKKNEDELTLRQAFLSGFFWPLKKLWQIVRWFLHNPPLKQIGHALRWFFLLPPLRFLGRVIGLNYIRDSWKELKGVTWLSFRESARLTRAVIFFSIVFGLLIAIVDFGLDKLFKQVLLK